MYRQACQLGSWEGCNLLAGAYENGTGVEQDPVQALAYYSRSCHAGSFEGCDGVKKICSAQHLQGCPP